MAERPLAWVSQQSWTHPDRDEVRDALDRRWARLLWSAGFQPLPLPNIAESVGALYGLRRPSLLIVTGGNDLLGAGPNTSPARDATERTALALALDAGVPVLAICRGLQHVWLRFGGSIKRAPDHAGTRHALRHTPGAESLPIAPAEVGSYHDCILVETEATAGFVVQARAPDGAIEVIERDAPRVVGLMWHPERDLSDLTALLHYTCGALS